MFLNSSPDVVMRMLPSARIDPRTGMPQLDGIDWSRVVVELTESTRKANAPLFPDGNVPTHAITMGIATILESKRIVLLVSGAPVPAKKFEGSPLIDAIVDGDLLEGAIKFAEKAVADKLPLKTNYIEAGVRVVPGGSARWGSYLESGVILMPSYVNSGAGVGSGTRVDTWASVATCARGSRRAPRPSPSFSEPRNVSGPVQKSRDAATKPSTRNASARRFARNSPSCWRAMFRIPASDS